MHIALVGAYTHPVAVGLRSLSAFLKSAGHAVSLIFMSSRRDTTEADYTPALIAAFLEHAGQADLIGMSLMTNNFIRASALTDAVRQAGLAAPVVWGGTHPTVAPEECLEQADFVCLGEGEHALLELVDTLERGGDPTRIEGFWSRTDGHIQRNPVRRLEENLDLLPFPDYDLEAQWIAARDRLVPAEPGLLRGALESYRLITTRGCPYHCEFCNNAALLDLHRGSGRWVRRRSIVNVLAEIEHMCSRFAEIQEINIVDDLFFIRPAEEIAEFCRLYRQRVNLPLQLDVFPNTLTREKLEALGGVPIRLISMGIQSGSEDTLRRIYKRPTSPHRIAQGIRLLSEARVPAEYHYITANPFEPEGNVIETLRFAAEHHRPPAIVRVFPLQFYPGTPLYERARAEGLLTDRHEMAYHGTYAGRKHLRQAEYLEIWLRVVLALRGAGLPARLVRALVGVVVHPVARRVLDRRWFPRFSYVCWRVGRRLWKALVYEPFVRPWRRLRGPPTAAPVRLRKRRTPQPSRVGPIQA